MRKEWIRTKVERQRFQGQQENTERLGQIAIREQSQSRLQFNQVESREEMIEAPSELDLIAR